MSHAATTSVLFAVLLFGCGRDAVEHHESVVEPRAPVVHSIVPDGFRLAEGARIQSVDGREFANRVVHERTGAAFVLVGGGDVWWGSEGWEEGPRQRIKLAPYYIAEMETTLAQWRNGGGIVPNALPAAAEHDDEPIVLASWDDAIEWCARNGLALSTEAQWEIACASPYGSGFPWGGMMDDASKRNLPFDERGEPRASAELRHAGSYDARSWFGTLDQCGNVFEWCRDTFELDRSWITSGTRNPCRVDVASAAKVVKGGSWLRAAEYATTCCQGRSSLDASTRAVDVGFRAVFECTP